MDFNEIKNTWKDSFKEKERLSSGQIKAMLKIKSKSNTALKKIKSSFKIELITGTLMYMFIISSMFFLMDFPESFIFFVIVSMLMGIPMIFYYRTYKKIRQTVYTENTLKQSLLKTTKDIKKFVMVGKNNYLRFILILLATITGMFMGLFIGTGENNIIEIFSEIKTRSIVKMIVLLCVFGGVLIPISRYWYKRKFKRHYDELKKCLREFEETENNKY
ncbi:MAG: hypothetical protein K8R58_09345 [Bacteroidales bacterium]|nr:hypothetical protein [Bacteroidales bacterium]